MSGPPPVYTDLRPLGRKQTITCAVWLDVVQSLRLQCTFTRPIKKYLNPLAFEPSIA